MKNRTIVIGVMAGALSLAAGSVWAQVTTDAPGVRPDAVIDLMTNEGAQLVKGQWRYSDTQIIQVAHQSPGADLGPSGPPNMTYDYTPHAGGADFDDAKWQVIDAPGLETRRSTGRLSFNGIASR